MKLSAGLLLYATTPMGLGLVLVHPSGAYNKKSPWGLPKGELDDGEDAFAAAVREVHEEVGVDVRAVASLCQPLGFVDDKKSKKRVFAWACPLPPGQLPRCASWEVDRAELVAVPQARALIHVDQGVFIDRLLALLGL